MWLNWDDFGNIRQWKLYDVLQNYFISLEVIHSNINHQLHQEICEKCLFVLIIIQYQFLEFWICAFLGQIKIR